MPGESPNAYPTTPTPVPGESPNAYPSTPNAYPTTPTPVPGESPNAYPTTPTPVPGESPSAYPSTPNAYPTTPTPVPGESPNAYPTPNAYPPPPSPPPGESPNDYPSPPPSPPPESASLPPSMTQAQVDQLERDIKQLSDKIARIEDRNPNARTLPGLRTELAALQREAGDAAPTSSPSQAPESASLPPGMTQAQVDQLERDIKQLSDKIARIEDRNPNARTLPGLRTELAALQRELDGDAAPTSSPSQAPESASLPPGMTQAQVDQLERDIKQLSDKIARIEDRNPNARTLPGLRTELAALQRELDGDAAPTSSPSQAPESASLPPGMTQAQVDQLERDIKQLSDKIARIEDRNPNARTLPGLRTELAALQRELDGDAAPTSSPSQAPESASLPPGMTQAQVDQLERDIKQLSDKIARIEDRNPNARTLPGLRTELAALQRELDGDAAPTSSPSQAPESASLPPGMTQAQVDQLERDIKQLSDKIARIEDRNPNARTLPGLRTELAALQRELDGDAAPTSSVSARLGSFAVSTRDLDVSRTTLLCVVTVAIAGIVMRRRLRRAPEFEIDEIARLL